eukprot:TRINITY_DN15697_c0_g1_i1.p1 TRINITY_DN15697_c0_g1~~TRINITY_DN15697_c0_g1_i1.p1  ORF type:complete len:592 (+),score=180.33 TRINITY_DN15697_c0_g1_i1:77-1852(+)
MPRVERLDGDDGVYEGECTDIEEDGESVTVPHGKGIYSWSNGDRYEGEFRRNMQCGRGKFTYACGGHYDGEWLDDQQHGNGHLEDVNGVYDGEFAKDERHGFGKQRYKNGDEYEGEWRHDKRHGKGRQRWAAKDMYEGQWVDNQMHGRGVYKFENGDVYEGEFLRDSKTGQGQYTWADSADDLECYIGGFLNGKRHGEGIERYRNGDWLAGTWEEGKHNGTQRRHKASEKTARQELEMASVSKIADQIKPGVATDVMAKLEEANQKGETLEVALPQEIVQEANVVKEKVMVPDPGPAPVEQPARPQDIDSFLKGESKGAITGWKLGNMLGQGSYGAVYAGLRRDGGMMAVKCIELGQVEDEEDLISLMNEIEVMKALSHSNIVRYLGASRDAEKNLLYIFLEYVPGGSLASIVKKFGNLDMETARCYTKQILFAVSFLHKKHVIHRDIKGDNILLTGDGVVKLADFGCSKNMRELCAKTHGVAAKSMVGTPYWMAPEVITNQQEGGYSYKADVWSIGCTVCEMLTGKAPWPEFSSMWGAVYHIANSSGPPDGVPKDVPASVTAFFDRCFQRDVSKRAEAQELLDTAWMKEC